MYDKAEATQTAARAQFDIRQIEQLARTLNSLTPYERDQMQRALERLNDPKDQTVTQEGSGVGFRPHGLTLSNVDDAFRVRPLDLLDSPSGLVVAESLLAAAKTILRNVVECPDRSAALRKLREVRNDVNDAIASGGRF